MIEIYPNLFIGNQNDYDFRVAYLKGWRVVHACKEPYHRQAVGYEGRGAPKDDPEYFFARRGHRLCLNLIDAPDPKFIPQQIMDEALTFIHEGLLAKEKVLVHCNFGMSRSPSIGLLYLLAYTDVLPKINLLVSISKFRLIYPPYRPSKGMEGFVASYCRSLKA